MITSGNPKLPVFVSGITYYAEKICRYTIFSVIHLPSLKNIPEPERLKNAEGKRILKNIKVNDYVILLDEHGKLYSSAELSNWLAKHQQRSTKSLVFLVGGPFGFSDEVQKRANEKISLSPLTLQHDLAALVFVEQLYRIFTILRGEKYHH